MFALLLLLLCFLRAGARGLPVMRFGHDIPILLDGCWRVLNGQRPHLDFYPGLGVMVLLIEAPGIWLARGAAYGLAYSAAIAGFVAGICSYAIASRGLNRTVAGIIGLVCALLVLAPFPVGSNFHGLSEAMIYNRYGYALAAIVLIETFLTPRAGRGQRFEGLSSGVALGICLFLKPTYFAAGAGIIAAGLLLGRSARAALLRTAAALVAVAFAVGCYMHFDLGPVLRDTQLLAMARAQGMGGVALWPAVKGAFFPGGLLLLPLAWFGTGEGWLARPWRRAVFAAAILAAGMALKATNFQEADYPFSVILALMLAAGAWQFSWWRRIAIAMLAIGIAGPGVAHDAAGLAYGFLKSYRPERPGVITLQAAPLAKLRMLGPSAPWDGEEYATSVNDGLDLLRRNSSADESVVSLDFSDLFNYALQRKPAPGGALWLVWQDNFSDAGPPPERIFGKSAIAMEPKLIWDEQKFHQTLRVYGPYLKSHFAPVAESRYWRMYRRTPDSQ